MSIPTVSQYRTIFGDVDILGSEDIRSKDGLEAGLVVLNDMAQAMDKIGVRVSNITLKGSEKCGECGKVK